MSARNHISVFVLIDALGWTFIKERDFLSDLLSHRQPLRTVLGYSSGAIPSLLTGRTPAQHGHWNLFYYDPDRSPFRWLRCLSMLPDRAIDNRIARKLLKELGRHVLGLGPQFDVSVNPWLLPWLNWVEKKNIYDRRGITGAPSIFDQMSEQGIRWAAYSYHRFTDAAILERALTDLETGQTQVSGEMQVYFLYLSEMDRFLHHHCEPDDGFERELARYAEGLRLVFERALAKDPDAHLMVMSDHGMTPVRRTVDLPAQIDKLGLGMPEDYLAVHDSTMSRFWFFNERARGAITARLAEISCGRILSDEELGSLGILFPDRRYGDVVFLLEPGWLVGGSGFNGSGWAPAGMHGYHPDDPYSDAIFLSNRAPAVPLISIVDLHGVMLEAAGATPTSQRRRV